MKLIRKCTASNYRLHSLRRGRVWVSLCVGCMTRFRLGTRFISECTIPFQSIASPLILALSDGPQSDSSSNARNGQTYVADKLIGRSASHDPTAPSGIFQFLRVGAPGGKWLRLVSLHRDVDPPHPGTPGYPSPDRTI